MRRRSQFFLFIGIVATLVAGYLYVTASWDAAEIARRDRQIADDIDAELVRFFSSLGPDHEITRRYGNFVAVHETEHSRHAGHI